MKKGGVLLMQYKVPQNIDIEDKIVGPFTMKQFLYLMVGGFICYGWWNYSNQFVSPPPIIIFSIVGFPVGLLCLCLAIVKVNDRPFEYFLLNIFKFIISPKSRKWATGYVPEPVIKMNPVEAQEQKQATKTEADLDSLAKVLDRQTAEIKANTPTPATTQTKPQQANLSVNDVAGAAKNQVQSQAIPPKAKKGFLGVFK